MKKKEYTNELNLSLDEAISFYYKICEKNGMKASQPSDTSSEVSKCYIKLSNVDGELATVYSDGSQLMLDWPND